MLTSSFLSQSPNRAPQSDYSLVAREYYDPLRHPTCANFRDASADFIRPLLKEQWSISGLKCDVGAGDSIVAELSEQQGLLLDDLIVTDRAPQMLSYSLKYKNQGAQLVIADADKLPFPSNSISLLVSSLGDPYNTPSFWREVHRVLEFKGKCIFTTPSYDWACAFRSSESNEMQNFARFDLSDGSQVFLRSSILREQEQVDLILDAGMSVKLVRSVSASSLATPVSPKLKDRRTDAILDPVTGYLVEKR